MKRLLHSIFDAITLPLCGIGVVRAVIGALAYQWKRIVEARLPKIESNNAMVGEDRLGLQDWFYLEPKP